MKRKSLKQRTVITLMGCLIVVLQFIATFINFGGFPITLTLIPIIVAGAIYGIKVASILGGVFGVIVTIMVVTGLDASGATMLASHPFITIMVCLLKGVLAGLLSSLTYQLLKEKSPKIAIIASSIVAPVVNTVTFFIVLIIFFESSFVALVGYLTSINFVVELLLDVILAPSLQVVINRYKNRE